MEKQFNESLNHKLNKGNHHLGLGFHDAGASEPVAKKPPPPTGKHTTFDDSGDEATNGKK